MLPAYQEVCLWRALTTAPGQLSTLEPPVHSVSPSGPSGRTWVIDVRVEYYSGHGPGIQGHPAGHRRLMSHGSGLLVRRNVAVVLALIAGTLATRCIVFKSGSYDSHCLAVINYGSALSRFDTCSHVTASAVLPVVRPRLRPLSGGNQTTMDVPMIQRCIPGRHRDHLSF